MAPQTITTNLPTSTGVNDPKPTAPSTNNHKSLSAGAVAGIGIAGGLLIGLILGCLAFWLIMKRSKKHTSRGQRSNGSVNEKSIGLNYSAVQDETLLDRADDSQLLKAMQDLNEVIDQHVENHYHLDAFAGSQSTLQKKLRDCGYAPDRVTEVSSLLVNPETRFAAIRAVIAKIMLGNAEFIASKTRPEMSLLPPPVVEFSAHIPPVEAMAGADEVFDRAFIRWRHLSAFLLSPARTTREAPAINEPSLHNAIAQNVTAINNVLRPFIKPGSEAARYQEGNLRAIIPEAAQLGLLLFSQPSVWSFGWKAAGREDGKAGRSFMIFPALGERKERHGSMRVREVAAPVVLDL